MRGMGRVIMTGKRTSTAGSGIALAFFALLPLMSLACSPQQEQAPAAPEEAEAAQQEAEAPAESGEDAAADPTQANETAEAEPTDEPGPEPVLTVATPAELKAMIEGAQGTPLVVNFWATWCPPCVKEMPYFVELYEAKVGDGLKLIMVSADHPDTIEDAVKPFMRENDIPFESVVIDGMPDQVSDGLGIDEVGALPVTLVYRADGKLFKRWDGEVSKEELFKAAEAVMPS